MAPATSRNKEQLAKLENNMLMGSYKNSFFTEKSNKHELLLNAF